MGKGVIKKHTAKEIQAKIDAHKNKGGGAAGIDSRKPKCTLVCKICKSSAPNTHILGDHYAAKHPKEKYNPAEYEMKE